MKFYWKYWMAAVAFAEVAVEGCTIQREGATEYVSDSADLTYTDQPPGVAATTDIMMEFNSTLLGASDADERIEVVVWGGSSSGCDYSRVLGKTGPGASLVNPVGTPTELNETVVSIVVSPLTSDIYEVQLDTTWNTPQYAGLLDGIYIESADGSATAYMCIEFQHFACDEKRDFETVFLEIGYNLLSSCNTTLGGPCTGIAYIVREATVVPGKIGDVAAPNLDCYLGNPRSLPAHQKVFNQGDEIKVCLQYDWTNVDGSNGDENDDVCFKEVLELEAVYTPPPLPAGTPQVVVDLLGLPNEGWVEVMPNGQHILNRCIPPDLNEDAVTSTGCCILFVLNAELFQALPVPGDDFDPTDYGRIDVMATLQSTYLDCVFARRSLRAGEGSRVNRGLQLGGPISRDVVSFQIQGAPRGCGFFDIFCWINALFSSIMAFFGF